MADNDAEPRLIGRRKETELLLGLLPASRDGRPGLAVVSGPAGIGKTALISDFADGQDVRVLRASGTPWESDLAHGVLDQLLTLSRQDRILSRPEPGNPGAAGPAFLELLRSIAKDGGGVLVCIDDLQWADAQSLRALHFALRRLNAASVMVVLALDPAGGRPIPEAQALLDLAGTTRIRLNGLQVPAVRDLVRRTCGTELPAPAIHRIHAHTGGNPRYVLELLADHPTSIWSDGTSTLPAPRSVTAAVDELLGRLSAPTVALVNAAAVLGTSGPFALAAGLAGLEDPVAAVDESHVTGLLRLESSGAETTVAFADALSRAAVYHRLSPAERVRLHQRASTLLADPHQRLMHRTAGALVPDAALSAELEEVAQVQAAAGMWAMAADAYFHAGRLHPEPSASEALMVQAVDAMAGAGDIPRAVSMSETLDRFAPSPLRDAVRGYVAILRGRPAQADGLLQKAWSSVDAASDPETAAMICQRQVLHALARFHGRDLVMWAKRAVSLVEAGNPAAVESRAIAGLGLGAMGRYEDAEESYRTASLIPSLSAQAQRIDMGLGWLHLAQDRPEQARAELAGAVPTEFRQGSQRISLWAQAWLARTDFTLGAWDDALATVDGAVAVQEQTGLELVRPILHWTAAQIFSLRGQWDSAATHLLAGAAASDSYPVMLLPHCLAQAHFAESRADYDGVIRALSPILRLPRANGIDEPGFWPWQDLYANALFMVGRVDEAAAFLLPHEKLAEERQHRSTMARLAYVRGRILASQGSINEARSVFLRGLEHLDGLPMPLARARVKFAYGQSFRRAGKRREAATVLKEARDIFSMLGAEAYVYRCTRELRASGSSAPSTAGGHAGGGSGPALSAAAGRSGGMVDMAAWQTLTAQEQSVGALVAAGLSNKQVAAELYISVKTVQYHLTRVYAKYGITSRSELAAAYRSSSDG